MHKNETLNQIEFNLIKGECVVEKYTSTELFIKISNLLLTEDSPFHLTPEELYIYSFISQKEDRKREVLITPSLVHSFMKVKFGTREDNATKKIIETLFSLRDKNVIAIKDNDDKPIEKVKSNQGVKVRILPLKENGHVQILYKMFEAFDDVNDFYLYTLVARWENAGGFNCSYDRWASLLGKSRRTAIRLVNTAIAKGLFYKNIGDYYDDEENTHQKHQDINTYNINPFSYEDKSIMSKNKDIEIAIKKFHEEHEYSDSPIHHLDLNSGIARFETRTDENGTSVYPNEDDYIFYLEVLDITRNKKKTELEKKFLFVANTRITSLMKGENIKFKKAWENAYTRYNENYKTS